MSIRMMKHVDRSKTNVCVNACLRGRAPNMAQSGLLVILRLGLIGFHFTILYCLMEDYILKLIVN